MGSLTASTRPICYGVLKPGPEVPGGVPLLKIQDIAGDRISLSGVQRISRDLDDEFSRSRLNGGEVLLSIQGTIGRVAVVPTELAGANISRTLAVIQPDDRVEPAFLAYVLRAVSAAGSYDVGGTTRASLNISTIREMTVPVPPIEEQRRIVALLDDRLSRIEAASGALATVLRRALVWRASVLAAGVRGDLVDEDLSEGSGLDVLAECSATPLTMAGTGDRLWAVPPSWAWTQLGSVASVHVGTTPSRSRLELWNGEVPWVSSGEVAFNRITATRERISRVAATRTRIHPPGTVMLAMIGEGKTRGQAAILDIEATHNQNCAAIRLTPQGLLPEYLYFYLQERYLETRRLASGGNQPALNKAIILQMPVPIPPPGTQRRLVEAFRAQADAEGRLVATAEAAMRAAGGLRRSLLSKTFSGARVSGTGERARTHV